LAGNLASSGFNLISIRGEHFSLSGFLPFRKRRCLQFLLLLCLFGGQFRGPFRVGLLQPASIHLGEWVFLRLLHCGGSRFRVSANGLDVVQAHISFPSHREGTSLGKAPTSGTRRRAKPGPLVRLVVSLLAALGRRCVHTRASERADGRVRTECPNRLVGTRKTCNRILMPWCASSWRRRWLCASRGSVACNSLRRCLVSTHYWRSESDDQMPGAISCRFRLRVLGGENGES